MSGGFPDFQKIVRWFGPQIVDGQFVWTGADISLGPFNVASYKTLTLMGNPGVGNLKVVVSYRSRSAFTTVRRAQAVYFAAGANQLVTIPALGDVIDAITLTGATNPQTVTLIVVPSNVDSWVKYPAGSGVVGYIRNSALAAGANTTFGLGQYAGAAGFVFNSTVYPCAVSIVGWDHAGAEQAIVWENPAVAAPVNGAIVLPTLLNQVKITNNGAALAAVSYCVVPQLQP